jgi:hypothetical protein
VDWVDPVVAPAPNKVGRVEVMAAIYNSEVNAVVKSVPVEGKPAAAWARAAAAAIVDGSFIAAFNVAADDCAPPSRLEANETCAAADELEEALVFTLKLKIFNYYFELRNGDKNQKNFSDSSNLFIYFKI